MLRFVYYYLLFCDILTYRFRRPWYSVYWYRLPYIKGAVKFIFLRKWQFSFLSLHRLDSATLIIVGTKYQVTIEDTDILIWCWASYRSYLKQDVTSKLLSILMNNFENLFIFSNRSQEQILKWWSLLVRRYDVRGCSGETAHPISVCTKCCIKESV